jgi:chromate transport protein ChrA
VYALLSGLNAATVWIIALAAVELLNKAITDKLTRILVFLTAAAGMLYNALSYFQSLCLPPAALLSHTATADSTGQFELQNSPSPG